MSTITGRGVVTAASAVTIEAPAETVWPWLVQMGQGRAGFYSYTWIQNILGARIRNLNRIDPAYQALHHGDRIWLTPRTYHGRPGQFWTAAAVDAGHRLVLSQSPPDNPHRRFWTLTVEPAGAGRTKLISRHTGNQPRARAGARLAVLLWALGASLMEYGVLHGIKRRAEVAASCAVQAEDNRCSLCAVGWIRTIDLGSRHVVHLHDWCDGCSWRLCTRSHGQCTWQSHGR
jgi:hypothetical protein